MFSVLLYVIDAIECLNRELESLKHLTAGQQQEILDLLKVLPRDGNYQPVLDLIRKIEGGS